MNGYKSIEVYDYKGCKYTVEQLYDNIIKKLPDDRREMAKSIIFQHIFADILTRGKMPIFGKKVESMAKHHEIVMGDLYSSASKRGQIRLYNKYHRRLRFLSFGKPYFDMHNMRSSLNKLLDETLGRENVPYNVCSKEPKFKLVSLMQLTEEQCEQIAKNFKRMAKGKKPINYSESNPQKFTR